MRSADLVAGDPVLVQGDHPWSGWHGEIVMRLDRTYVIRIAWRNEEFTIAPEHVRPFWNAR